jgi:general secretion pathway protein C
MKIQNTKFILDYRNPQLMLIGAIFIISSLLFLWEIYDLLATKQSLPLTVTPMSRTPQGRLESNSPIFTSALFGDYIPATLSDKEIKKSMLDAEVVGILYSSKAENSQVIIRTAGGQEKIYSIGDSLPGGAVIRRISETGVVVLRNGSLESLSLQKNELIFDAPAKPLKEDN